ncbi:MAG TPA: hypothetical protein VF741_06350 [Candidatus Aquilonibacter sp.]
MCIALIGWFENLPLGAAAILLVGGFVLLSLLLARVVAIVVPNELLREHNELAGFIFAVVGVIYAVLLGFVAVNVWERFVVAEERTYDEASSVTAVYRDAGSFSNWRQLRRDVRTYVNYAIRVGWPALEAGKEPPDSVDVELLSRDVHHTPVHDLREAQVFEHMLERTSETMRDRDARLAEDATGLSSVMWGVVFLGGFITIAFSYLFGFQRTVMQTVMIGTLALLIGLMLFLTMSLDFPFRGAIHVGPEAFQRAIHDLDQIDAVSVHNVVNAKK